MKNFLVLSILSVLKLFPLFSQIKPDKIDIVRDKYGVPHIFAKTDAEVAYGLAWAHAEDDFKTIQIGFLAGNNLLSKYIGNKGIGVDFLSQFIGSDKLFEEKYESEISPEYKLIINAYAAGINRYAVEHPKEILVNELFL